MTGDWIRGIMIVHCGKPIPSDIYRSKSAKFQLCITAFPSKGPCHICSLLLTFSKSGRRNNAKSAFQYTVNNNTIEYAKKKKKKRKNNVWTFKTICAVGHRLTGLNLSAVTKPSFATGNPGSVIVPQYASSKITLFVWSKNIILKFLGNTK